MAEITKVTTPMIPRENMAPKQKPVTDHTFDLTDPTKVHKSGQDEQVRNQQKEGLLQGGVGREMAAPLLRSATDLIQAFHKITVLLQMGVSTSDVMADPEVKALLESLYLRPDQLAQAIMQQDASSVLFKGAAFDVLRDILAKFEDNPRIRHAMAGLLKSFEQNVNMENSVKTILLTCRNLLDYMFSKDRAQFSEYLKGLSDMLLPKAEEEAGAAKEAAQQQGKEAVQQQGKEAVQQQGKEGQPPVQPGADGDEVIPEAAKQQSAAQAKALGVDYREAAQILKGNLLPLLGEIVVKYNQSEKIRDMVMVVVHNIVRVDQGSPEVLREAVAKLIHELRLVANLPENFAKQLTDAVMRSTEQVKGVQNETLDKLVRIIADALSSPNASAATIRQSENLLMSLLQNQSAAMNVLHFMLPMDTPNGKVFAEMYVDPDNDEKVSRSQEDRARKIFLAFESDSLGSFELAFVESGTRVDCAMWCPEALVQGLGGIKRQIGEIMKLHGYTMNSYSVAELVSPQSIADVFPRLLERRMGVDVRI